MDGCKYSSHIRLLPHKPLYLVGDSLPHIMMLWSTLEGFSFLRKRTAENLKAQNPPKISCHDSCVFVMQLTQLWRLRGKFWTRTASTSYFDGFPTESKGWNCAQRSGFASERWGKVYPFRKAKCAGYFAMMLSAGHLHLSMHTWASCRCDLTMKVLTFS